ncbi:RNA polymerase sigma-70 factor (ECF subfamily) [Desulfobotulus alkaliphilus]|uniref:RNA polymerase sigma-70 factor (ECF subfamily) n=1 Tax=Desulfobotulus alkaliphilus TaxID=622671 RepID=A0A562S674_9BACT|nr:sigma-70 family RNA polymerase sigma factor [Desulfobotulus alkaliphilus]TWI76827.1 RNA polymerase sigma-70 factor (ECF subfamily) [Desulfobotulus alkaliphilus]
MQAINQGQGELFEELVRRYQARLYNFGLRICKDSRDAEDLVQETFINIFRYMSGFRQESLFRNWVYRIAVSVCIKMRRRSKFAPERELSLEDVIPGDAAEAPEELPQWAREPVDRLLNEELGARIKAAIDELPPTYRLVVVLRDMEDFSTEETARILDISQANVKVRLHRARFSIREALKGYFSHEPS